MSHSRGHTPGGSGDENDPPPGALPGSETERVNPFEKDVLAGLQKSFWSPSILEIHETPPQRGWAIEHLSHLFPKEIENSPSSHQNAFPVDDQTEAQAQADIDLYFSRGSIVPTPSPMKEKALKVLFHHEVSRVNKTTVSYNHNGHGQQSPIARIGVGSSGVISKKKVKVIPMTERWTQTSLSLPINLPAHVEDILSQYSQNDLCGSAGEEVACFSQKSGESLDPGDGGDTNDSGKNSSSLNNSIRRRLELSFGDDPDGEDSNAAHPTTYSPQVDPFRRNHVMSTPPSHSFIPAFNTTTAELELQLMRCEFTPEARGVTVAVTPGITPIHDEPDELRFSNVCSTPRRPNGGCNSKRQASGKDDLQQWPTSSHECETKLPVQITSLAEVGENGKGNEQNHLRRSREESVQSEGTRKRISAVSSFEDEQFLMDDSSPPTKVYKRNSETNAMNS